MRKKILCLVFGLNIAVFFGQQVSIQTNAGLISGLDYKYNEFESDLNFSYDVGINLAYYFTDKLALESGIHYGKYKTTFNIPKSLTIKSNEVDSQSSAFELATKVKGYKEVSDINTLMLPLMLRYEVPIASKTKYYISTGIRYVLTLGQKTNTKIGELNLSGYYPDTNLTIDDLPNSGFGTVHNFNSMNSKNQLDDTFALALDTGLSFLIKNFKMYAGVYLNYGISDYKRYKENVTGRIIKYNPTQISQEANSIVGLKEVNGIHFVSLGISLKFVVFDKKEVSNLE